MYIHIYMHIRLYAYTDIHKKVNEYIVHHFIVQISYFLQHVYEIDVICRDNIMVIKRLGLYQTLQYDNLSAHKY